MSQAPARRTRHETPLENTLVMHIDEFHMMFSLDSSNSNKSQLPVNTFYAWHVNIFIDNKYVALCIILTLLLHQFCKFKLIRCSTSNLLLS